MIYHRLLPTGSVPPVAALLLILGAHARGDGSGEATAEQAGWKRLAEITASTDEQRASIAKWLIQQRPALAIPIFLSDLQSPEPDIRERALSLIQGCCAAPQQEVADRCRAIILGTLVGRESEELLEAIRAGDRASIASAVNTLAACLVGEHSTDQSRQVAVLVLPLLGPEGAHCMSSALGLLRPQVPSSIRSSIVYWIQGFDPLPEVGKAALRDFLVKSPDHVDEIDSLLRTAATILLDDPALIDYLIVLAANGSLSESTRATALELLAGMGSDERVFDLAKREFGSENLQIRGAVDAVLKKYGDQSAEFLLERQLSSPLENAEILRASQIVSELQITQSCLLPLLKEALRRGPAETRPYILNALALLAGTVDEAGVALEEALETYQGDLSSAPAAFSGRLVEAFQGRTARILERFVTSDGKAPGWVIESLVQSGEPGITHALSLKRLPSPSGFLSGDSVVDSVNGPTEMLLPFLVAALGSDKDSERVVALDRLRIIASNQEYESGPPLQLPFEAALPLLLSTEPSLRRAAARFLTFGDEEHQSAALGELLRYPLADELSRLTPNRPELAPALIDLALDPRTPAEAEGDVYQPDERWAARNAVAAMGPKVHSALLERIRPDDRHPPAEEVDRQSRIEAVVGILKMIRFEEADGKLALLALLAHPEAEIKVVAVEQLAISDRVPTGAIEYLVDCLRSDRAELTSAAMTALKNSIKQGEGAILAGKIRGLLADEDIIVQSRGIELACLLPTEHQDTLRGPLKELLGNPAVAGMSVQTLAAAIDLGVEVDGNIAELNWRTIFGNEPEDRWEEAAKILRGETSWEVTERLLRRLSRTRSIPRSYQIFVRSLLGSMLARSDRSPESLAQWLAGAEEEEVRRLYLILYPYAVASGRPAPRNRKDWSILCRNQSIFGQGPMGELGKRLTKIQNGVNTDLADLFQAELGPVTSQMDQMRVAVTAQEGSLYLRSNFRVGTPYASKILLNFDVDSLPRLIALIAEKGDEERPDSLEGDEAESIIMFVRPELFSDPVFADIDFGVKTSEATRAVRGSDGAINFISVPDAENILILDGSTALREALASEDLKMVGAVADFIGGGGASDPALLEVLKRRRAEIADALCRIRLLFAIARLSGERSDFEELLTDFSSAADMPTKIAAAWALYVLDGARQNGDLPADEVQVPDHERYLAGLGLVAAPPELYRTPYQKILALLDAGDRDGAAREAGALLKTFRDTIDTSITNAVAWSAVVAPLTAADAEIAVSLAEQAVASSDEGSRANSLNTLGGALYRAGRYADAIKRLEEAIQTREGKSVPHDWVLLAMAHHRLGQHEEAHRWLNRFQEEQPENGDAPPSEDRDLQVLRREAEELILDLVFPAIPFCH